MKKAIATALALLLTSCGYVLVDQKLVDRVTTLESQVEELREMHGLVEDSTRPIYTTEPYEPWGTEESSKHDPTTTVHEPVTEFWGNIYSDINLPQTFASKTGAGSITITSIIGRCETYEIDPDTSVEGDTTVSNVYAQKTTYQTTYPGTTARHSNSKGRLTPQLIEPISPTIEPDTPTRPNDTTRPDNTNTTRTTRPDKTNTTRSLSGDEYEISTFPPIVFRYETTLQIKGYVSEEFLMAGKTMVHIRLGCYNSSWFTRDYDFNIVVDHDGSFSQRVTIPYQIRQITEISAVSAE